MLLWRRNLSGHLVHFPHRAVSKPVTDLGTSGQLPRDIMRHVTQIYLLVLLVLSLCGPATFCKRSRTAFGRLYSVLHSSSHAILQFCEDSRNCFRESISFLKRICNSAHSQQDGRKCSFELPRAPTPLWLLHPDKVGNVTPRGASLERASVPQTFIREP